MQKSVTKESTLILWHIEEAADWFQNQLQLDETELATIGSMQKMQRKIHWLSSRFLIRRLLKTERFIELKEDEYGRPDHLQFQCSYFHFSLGRLFRVC